MTEDQRCTATTKAGKNCKAARFGDLDVCLSHAPAEIRVSRGFGGAQRGSGRPARLRPSDRLKIWEAENGDQIRQVLTEAALGATRHVVVGNGPKARVEEVPDIPTRLAAIRELYDRTEGRPTQRQEVTGADGGPITHADADKPLVPDSIAYHAEVAAVLAEAEALTDGDS